MTFKKKPSEKLINLIIALGCVIVSALILGICFDYYYDLNDDVLIKDLMSGAYTGTPEKHNIQICYLLSKLISGFYKILPAVPWYGLFLYICQFGSVLVIVNRTIKLTGGRLWIRIVTAVAETFFLVSMMLGHMINIQYTITVAMMAGAAILWFLASESSGVWDAFWVKNFLAVVLIFFAFLLRTEMLLLMMPFIAAAGIIKWSFEDQVFTKSNFLKYLFVFGTILLALGVGFVSDKIAFRSSEWKSFHNLFDARTELYDFRTIPEYEGNEEFYENLGLLPSEQVLLENYNYGIDSSIDADTLWSVAEYSKQSNTDVVPLSERIKEKGREYLYRISHGRNSVGSDYPMNLVTVSLYLLCFLLMVTNRRFRQIIGLVCLFAFRTLTWMYILLGERAPERITDSLYFVEVAVLLGTLGILLRESSILIPKIKGLPNTLFAVVLVMCIGLFIADGGDSLSADQAMRESVNEKYIELYEYASAHPDEYFLMDVYSSVSYSEKIFDKRVKSLSKKNVDLLGGWAYGSVPQKAKLEFEGSNQKSLGGRSFEDILLNEDNVFYVQNPEFSSDWIYDYYSDKGASILLSLKETIKGGAAEYGELGIYDVNRQ